jgi:hypothetical protein
MRGALTLAADHSWRLDLSSLAAILAQPEQAYLPSSRGCSLDRPATSPERLAKMSARKRLPRSSWNFGDGGPGVIVTQ